MKNYAIGISAISLIILGLVYAHGVRKGKELEVAHSLKTELPGAEKTDSGRPINDIAASEGNAALLDNLERMMKTSYEVKPGTSTSGPELEQAKTDFYTIQLVSYQDIERARQEADKLNQKGYHTLILRSGKYSAVCIDKLEDKIQAARRLSELQNILGATYPGALVRFVKTKSPAP